MGNNPQPDDDGCPKSDPGCLADNGDCHDDCVMPPSITSIVPAFFAIDAPAEEADRIASDHAVLLNMTKPWIGAGHPRMRLFLCEASPTTEFEDDTIPKTLEGLTIDSGSDRSATGLIHRIVTAQGASNRERLSNILQMAEGWLRQRMALHPSIKLPEAAPTEQQDAADLLLHAYARGEASGGSIDWDDLNTAFNQAMAEHPDRYAQVLALYEEQQVMSAPVDVLWVMKQLAGLAFESGADEGPEGNEPAYRLHQDAVAAVDAVAEEIEAHRALLRACLHGNGAAAWSQIKERSAKAIAGVGGAP